MQLLELLEPWPIVTVYGSKSEHFWQSTTSAGRVGAGWYVLIKHSVH